MNSNSYSGVIAATTIGLIISCLLAMSTAHAAEPQKARHRTVNHPVIGHQVRTLPRGHQNIRVNRDRYRYYNGEKQPGVKPGKWPMREPNRRPSWR